MIGEKSIMDVADADQTANEFYEEPTMGVVKDSGHYVSEENLEGFVKQVRSSIEGGEVVSPS